MQVKLVNGGRSSLPEWLGIQEGITKSSTEKVPGKSRCSALPFCMSSLVTALGGIKQSQEPQDVGAVTSPRREHGRRWWQ